jgi:4-hydroxy-tetrahydrodipicolinate synthase
MPTPYRPDGEVDLVSVRRLVHFLLENGAHGMAPNGGDSECRYLTLEERRRITDTVVEANGGRTPVLVGTSAPSTEESVQLSRYAQQAGAEAVFVKPPGDREDLSDHEMIAHYQAVCENLDLPVMVHATGNMGVPFLERLLEGLPQIQYLKEETSHGSKLRQYVRELGERVAVFGPGRHYPAELEWGARGVMPSCCAPHLHARIFDLWQEGKREEARREWHRLLPLVFWRWHTFPQEAGKVLLKHQGIFETAYVRPDWGTLRLDEADRQEMLTILATLEGPPYGNRGTGGSS